MRKNMATHAANDGSTLIGKVRQTANGKLSRVRGRVAGIDARRDSLVVCALGNVDDPDCYEITSSGTFKKDVSSFAPG